METEIELETEIETEQTITTLTPKADKALWQIKNNVYQNEKPRSWAKNILKRLKNPTSIKMIQK